MNDDDMWKNAVTLQEYLYKLFKEGKKESDEFKFYWKYFGKDTVKSWLAREDEKAKAREKKT
jgi:hypothetical protein